MNIITKIIIVKRFIKLFSSETSITLALFVDKRKVILPVVNLTINGTELQNT